MTTLTDRPNPVAEVDEQPLPVPDLALGDVITRDIASTPVRWTLTCDPTSCRCGYVRVMCRTADGTWLPLSFLRRDIVTVRAPNARHSLRAVKA
ncbi:MAG: hypothetical protein V4597_14605 [Pseudomonadota bacterium]